MQKITEGKNQRKSIRLREYDYSLPGNYYVTVCTQNRRGLLGKIDNQEMILNDIGCLIDQYWQKIPQKFINVSLDKYIIMPNHIHGIITINENNGRTHGSAPTGNDDANNIVGVDPCVNPKTSLIMIIQWFKTMTTNQYINNVKEKNWPRFNKHIWQRGYYEHVIRNEKELNRIRKYILDNPQTWSEDENYFN